MSNVIQFNEPPKQPKTCSFCKATENTVKHMFSNDQEGSYLRFICDRCINKCKILLDKETPNA